MVENCIVGLHTLFNLPYVPSSMNVLQTKAWLIRMGRSKNKLTNSHFFAPGMQPEADSWPEKMSEMVMQITIEFLKKMCQTNKDSIVAHTLMELLLVQEPRVPGGSGGGNGQLHFFPPPSPLRSPMRKTTLALGDLAMTPPSSPTFSPKSTAIPPLARFVIEVVDELIQPIIYGGLGGPSEIFSNIPVSEFLRLVSLVYKQNRLECMAAMDAILEYTCQCRHEELLVVVGLLSTENSTGNSSGSQRPAQPDELELFTMSKVKETAEYWRDIELVVLRIQTWYKRKRRLLGVRGFERGFEGDEGGFEGDERDEEESYP